MNRMLIGPVILALAMACGERFGPDEIPDIDGAWTLTESLQGNSSSCRFLGTLDVAQDGERFSAQFTRTSQCTSATVPGTATAQTGSVIAGRVGRETVDYRIGDCDYRGVIVSDGRPNQVTGSIFCTTILSSGDLSTATGTWNANRVTE